MSNITNSKTFSAVVGCVVVTSFVVVTFERLWWRKRHGCTNVDDDDDDDDDDDAAAYESLVGKTPLIKLRRLSQLIQRDVYVKMESMNPGGTGKDRAALGMIRAAERQGQLPTRVTTSLVDCKTAAETQSLGNPPNGNITMNGNAQKDQNTLKNGVPPIVKGAKIDDATLDAYIVKAMTHSTSGGLVVEGTSGSTGIALATLCQSRGHACLVTLPDDQALEKQQILAALGAVVLVVPTASISHPQHYVNLARRVAQRARQHHRIAAVFMNQFENPANVATHYTETGPEIWKDCCSSSGNARVDAFCMSAGTGGTIAGVGRYLKEQSGGKCRVVLVDPPGSVLYHKIQNGIAYTPQQAERSLKRHRYDTIAEGIGLDRMTHNVTSGLDYVDEAIRVTDQEALDMAHWLFQNEGLWVGSSSSMNVVGAIRTALQLPTHSRVVTVICDAGSRHVTRFWNRDFCEKWGLVWPKDETTDDHRVPDCLRDIVLALNKHA